MNISSTGNASAAQAVQNTGSIDSKRLQLQAMMLRKLLDSQQQQADELIQQMQGKGQIIDLRV